MEEWLSILFKVATPILKTIVYAGTNTLLNEIQDELHKEETRQAKLMLGSLGIGGGVEIKKNKEDFFDTVTGFNYQKGIEIQDLLQGVTSSITQASWEFQQQRFQQEKAIQQQLATQKREQLMQIAAYQRQTALLMPQVQKIFDNWPLRLFPIQLLGGRSPEELIPLKVIIAPPKSLLSEFKQIGVETEEIEPRLSQIIREFLARSYPLHSQVRPIEFLGGAWESKQSYGEASIKALFWMLKSEPTIVLESEVEGDFLNFRIAYWGWGQEKYFYETIFKLSYKEFIEGSVKTRAIKWKETQQKLVELGKNAEEIQKLGGENVINLAILEEAQQLESAGIDIRDLEFKYKVTKKDVETFCQFLGICHCIVAAWIADIHYLVYGDRSPLLPQLLSDLVQEVADRTALQEAIRTIVSIYQDVFQLLGKERPYWMPELALKLARSLTHLPDRSLATEQVNYSIKIWLQQRELSDLTDLESLEIIQSNLTIQDREYLENLEACLLVLGDERGVTQVQSLLKAIANGNNYSVQSKSVSFSLSHTYNGLSEKIVALTINSQEGSLISVRSSNKIDFWDLTNCKPTSTNKLKFNGGEISTYAIAPDKQTLVSSDCAEQRSYIKIWNLQTGKLKQTLFGHKKQILSLAFSLDGQTLASGSHKIKLWNLKTGEPFQTFFGHKEWVHCVAISPDGQTVISGSEDKTIRVWNLNTGELRNTLTGHLGGVKAIALSPDNQLLVSASEDKTIKLWDLYNGKLLHTLTDHSGAVYTLTISHNGEYLISSSEDKTIKVWDLNTGELLQTLKGHSETINAIALSSDGKILASGSLDKTIKIWRNI